LLIRAFQRLLILGLGVLSVWLIVDVFHFVDRRLPFILALGLTYGIAAYVILPRAVRMGLKALQRKRVPRYTVTGDGLPGDPVNLALIGNLGQLRGAFALAGWLEAIAWASRAHGKWCEHSCLTDRIRPRPSVRFICSDAVRTSASRRRSTTAHASAITCGSGG
jgi:hypothetical protein